MLGSMFGISEWKNSKTFYDIKYKFVLSISEFKLNQFRALK